MSDSTCPFCSSSLNKAYLYVRGLGASLHISAKPNTRFISRSGLAQIDLDAISKTGTATQAVISALQCSSCDSISFRTTP